MATHGHADVARTLLGSVAWEVLHNGSFPVLFVPARTETTA
jgi:nucleotide-binding universal stress UspA family protein